jgi:hypothetical protein
MKAVDTPSQNYRYCKYCDEMKKFNKQGSTSFSRGFNGARCYACFDKYRASMRVRKSNDSIGKLDFSTLLGAWNGKEIHRPRRV